MNGHETEHSEWIRTKGVKYSGSKELRFSDCGKCVCESINVPIISFRIIKHVIYTIRNHKTVLCKMNDNENLGEDTITVYALDPMYHS